MKFNVQTKIDITFSEEQIVKALTDIIHKEMPHVRVRGIEFINKRKPSCTEAIVDAVDASTPIEDDVRVKSERQMQLDLDGEDDTDEKEEVSTTEEDTPYHLEGDIDPKQTVASIFSSEQ